MSDNLHVAHGGARRTRRLAARHVYTALGGWTEQYADDDWITLETGDRWLIAAHPRVELPQ